MRASKKSVDISVIYDIEDGPTQEGDPSRLRQVYFRVERLSLKYRNGRVVQVHLRGPNLLPNGEQGKLYHDRVLLVSEFPGWLIEFINKEEVAQEEKVLGEIRHHIAPVIGWLRMDAKRGIVDDDRSRLNHFRDQSVKASQKIARIMRGGV